MIEPDYRFGVTFLVRHAWLNMRSAVAVALADHGLSVQQYGALMVRALGVQHEILDEGIERLTQIMTAGRASAAAERGSVRVMSFVLGIG